MASVWTAPTLPDDPDTRVCLLPLSAAFHAHVLRARPPTSFGVTCGSCQISLKLYFLMTYFKRKSSGDGWWDSCTRM